MSETENETGGSSSSFRVSARKENEEEDEEDNHGHGEDVPATDETEVATLKDRLSLVSQVTKFHSTWSPFH